MCPQVNLTSSYTEGEVPGVYYQHAVVSKVYRNSGRCCLHCIRMHIYSISLYCVPFIINNTQAEQYEADSTTSGMCQKCTESYFMVLQPRKVELDRADDLFCKSEPSCLCWPYHEVAHSGRVHDIISLPLFLFLKLREKLGALTWGIAALRWFVKSSVVAEEHYVSSNWPATSL